MSEAHHSGFVTLWLIAALSGAIFAGSYYGYPLYLYAFAWPPLFAAHVLIAARIWRGHDWP